MTEESCTIGSGEHALTVLLGGDQSSDTAVILLHGGPGGDHHGPHGLWDVATTLVERLGLRSARFDFRGSGSSSMPPEHATIATGVDDTRTVAEHLRSDGAARVVIVGESLGAMIGIASSDVARVEIAALLWPCLNLFGTDLSAYLDPSAVRAARASGVVADGDMRLGASFIEECLDLDVGSMLRTVTTDVLVMHGDADVEVPMTHSQRAASLLGDRADLVIVAGGNHGLARPPERELVIDHLRRHLDGLTR